MWSTGKLGSWFVCFHIVRNVCKMEFRTVITLNTEFIVSKLFNGVLQVRLRAVSSSVVVGWDTHPYQ